MPAACVLDFDGLILDTETPLLEAWSRVHAQHGQVFDRAGGHGIIGHSDRAYDPWIAFPPEIDRHGLEVEFQAMKNGMIETQPILPGVVDLLDHARRAGILLGVASNSTHSHVDGHLQRLGLFEYFQAIVCRDDVVCPKPDPEVYFTVSSRLRTAPDQMIAFEDSGPGHTAAFRAGLKVVVVPNPSTRHESFPHADLRLASLVEFDLATA